jgi:cation diffusion facilitator CzcD-associated flavoprotein CzcO
MTTTATRTSETSSATERLKFDGGAAVDVDVLIIGAGFSGVRTLIEIRRLGLSATVIEAGTDVGGTWYWNRYPGARTDSQSWVYGFAMPELRNEWRWNEKFSTQPQTQGYLQLIADKFDLRKDIKFSTRVTAASYDEDANTWTVTTDDGASTTCRFFIMATGQLSLPYLPDFPGQEDFTGDWYQTQNWPKDGVDFTGKRVAVIGTGATAVQVIPLVAQEADELTVFQRTPNYVLPSRNDALSDVDVNAIRRNFDEIFARARQQAFGMDIPATAGRVLADCTPAEAQQVLERGWEYGGFRFLFETFDDIITNKETNDLAAEFIRNKIRSIVTDPETAELLCPQDYALAHKRPPLGHYYYETFNRPNVKLADASKDPITVTKNGLRVGDETYEVDAVITATGYDAITGTIDQIAISGRGGAKLMDKWTDGPRTHVGMMVDEFPNMFMIAGPQTPFANIPVVSEVCAEWVGDVLREMDQRGANRVEAKPEAVDKFTALNEAVIDATVLRDGGKHSWYLGTNIPGKPAKAVMWLGGVGGFRDVVDADTAEGYAGLQIS